MIGRANLKGQVLILSLCIIGTSAFATDASTRGTYRGVHQVVKFDVSPALRTIAPLPVPRAVEDRGGLMVDPDGDLKFEFGPQDFDPVVQSQRSEQRIPAPTVSFDGPPNLSGVSPPDSVGDIGPAHYVAMSNLFFEIYDRSGVSVFGPAANNTLWSGFGGPCETQNAGDPIILYDQLVDRWLLTQFTSSGAELFNCVALSTGPDPTGTYFRWAVTNGANFPDYPKYGVGDSAYYISTRDFLSGSYVGVGAYALNKAEMVAGEPNPTVISFFVDRTVPSNVGDGILPMDIDGFDLPPANSPHYFVGSMDDGGPYAAPQDALTVWEFVADFATPASSSFTLTSTVGIAAIDTIFPCGASRDCIPQPDTTNRIDIQSYRQRPLHRLGYRNMGSHESLVTNQSAEAAPGIGGVRWWEIRSPGSTPVIHQEGTYAPGVTDGIHRWMGSAAMDSAGNIALGYSASSETVFPSLYYTGRLSSDPLGSMNQGEDILIAGTGSQTGSQRWGDYSSLNVDPTDDCTFWYINEYVPTTSGTGWQLRIGAFRFNECGTPGFTLSLTSAASQSICAGDPASYDFNIGSIALFGGDVNLTASGNPVPTTTTFTPNPVAAGGASTLTIDNTAAAVAGSYSIQIDGTSAGADPRSINTELVVFDALPGAPTLTGPGDGAVDVPISPSFSWTGGNADTYTIEVATDAGFSNIVFSDTITGTNVVPSSPLGSSTQYFWRVRAANACGAGVDSSVFTFTTVPLPGDCPIGMVAVQTYAIDFESSEQGWTHSSAAGPDTWILTTGNANSGTMAWHGDDVAEVSDQMLQSPPLSIPGNLSNLTFQFQNYQEMEDGGAGCYDGGILEVSTNGGASFSAVDNADLLTDPYDGTMDGGFSNPLAGSLAWCGDPQPYLNSVVDINALAGQANVVFRFRLATDSSVNHPGWDIDDVVIQGCETDDIMFRNGFE